MIELNKIYNEDCLEGMKRIPDGSVKLLLTDPPYGIDYQSNWIKDKERRKAKIIGDKNPPIKFIDGIKRIISEDGAVMIFTRWDVQGCFIDALKQSGMVPKNILVWDKQIHGLGDLKRAFGSRYESIIFCANNGFRFNGKRPTDILSHRRVMPKDLRHPNEKPVSLLEELITKTTRDGDLVCDLFMGSGSTAVACINTNRKYIGFELDEIYYDIANDRISKRMGVSAIDQT